MVVIVSPFKILVSNILWFNVQLLFVSGKSFCLLFIYLVYRKLTISFYNYHSCYRFAFVQSPGTIPVLSKLWLLRLSLEVRSFVPQLHLFCPSYDFCVSACKFGLLCPSLICLQLASLGDSATCAILTWRLAVRLWRGIAGSLIAVTTETRKGESITIILLDSET